MGPGGKGQTVDRVFHTVSLHGCSNTPLHSSAIEQRRKLKLGSARQTEEGRKTVPVQLALSQPCFTAQSSAGLAYSTTRALGVLSFPAKAW